MPQIFERKIRFSDVVYAIETTPKSLRKWLQNPEVQLAPQKEEDQGWASFSYMDVAMLAIMRKLVDFGWNVVEANHLALTILNDDIFEIFSRDDVRIGMLPGMLRSIPLAIFRESDGWQVQVISDPDALPPNSKRKPNAWLVLILDDIVGSAFYRAAERVDPTLLAEGEI